MGGQQFNVIKHAVISKQSILKVRLLNTGEDFLQNFEVIEKLLRFWLKKLIHLWLSRQLIDLPENFQGEKMIFTTQ